MNDPAALSPISPAVQLDIRGLDNLTNNMVGGGLYVLIAETPQPVLVGVTIFAKYLNISFSVPAFAFLIS